MLTFFREYTRDSGTDKQNLAYGILLVVVLLALPGGLADQRVLRGGRWVRDRFTGGRERGPSATSEPAVPSETPA